MKRYWTLPIVGVLALAADAPRSAAAPPVTVADFRRDRLLERFDRDGDGRLDETEKGRLRDAFGGIDVPMLPPDWPDYTGVRLPRYVDAKELAKTDNTPADNPLTGAGATLGRVLFYDKQLSRNGTVSCASCHSQQHAFADPRRYSAGFEGERTARNAMSLVNLRYSNIHGNRPGLFWDERAPTLEAQALMPIQDKIEMGMSLEELERTLQTLPYYPPLFDAAFGSDRVSSDRVAQAIAQFVRSLQSWDSRFDRAASKAHGGDGGASAGFDEFSPEENLGKSLFFDGARGVGEFGCAHCHVPPTFSMPQAFNNGLDVKYADRGLGALGRPSNDPFTPSNDGKFKAPSLRNVALTAPYMHDGRFKTLEEVVAHYSHGVQPHENLGLALEDQEPDEPGGFQFTAEERAALVAFLRTLTDDRFIADPRFSDPFVRLDEKKMDYGSTNSPR